MYEFPSSSKTLTTLVSLTPLKIPGRSEKEAETSSLLRTDSTPLSPFTSEQTGKQEQDLDQPVSKTWGWSQTGGSSKSIASPQKQQCRSRWVCCIICLIQNGSSHCAAVTKVAIGYPEKCPQAALAGAKSDNSPDNSGLLPIQLWAVTWPRLDDGGGRAVPKGSKVLPQRTLGGTGVLRCLFPELYLITVRFQPYSMKPYRLEGLLQRGT